jgi:hypothetical protein
MSIVTRNISVALTLLLSAAVASAQKWVRVADAPADQVVNLANEVYGLDQQLVNGVFFEDIYRGSDGHPYLLEDSFVEGSLVFRNKAYESVMIKYDIYAQQLLINHLHEGYTMASILTGEFVNSFQIHGKQFRKMTVGGVSVPAYYQVLAELEHLHCYAFWFKARNESINDNNTRYDVFMPERKRFYLEMEGNTGTFMNNWTFKKQFSGEVKRKVRKYLRTYDIKVQDASDEAMIELLEQCNNWTGEKGETYP